MAEKKIFTSLAFQSGAKLVAPKVEIVSVEANLTTPTDNSNYYTGSAGQLAYNNGNIWVNNDSIWTKVLNHASTATISGSFTFDRVDGNSAGVAPFIIGSESTNVLVAGLNADKVDGYDARNALNDGNTHSIPRRDNDDLFHVGASSYTESAYDSHGDTQVANKALVAAGIAKLVNSAPEALDTLGELATALTANDGDITTITTALGNRLRIDVNNQGLSATQLTNARTNLGLGALATLATVGASEITNGSVDTAELADDAVDADKLDSSASFLMGRLGIGAGNSSGGALGIQHGAANQVNITHDGADTNEWGLLLGHGNGTAVGSYHGLDNAAVINVVNAPLHLGTNNAAIMTLASGKVLVGRTDTPSSITPNGTLHVSTARYGGEEVTDGTFPNFDNWTQTPSSAWSVANNTASCDGTQSGYANLIQTNVFTANKEVRLKVEVTVTAGSVQIWANGSQSLISGISSTQSINQVVSPTVTGTIQFECSSNFVGTFKNLSVKEDFLSTQAGDNLSINAAADDLVIANNDDAGISIITPIDKKGSIFFGDKNDNDRGGIKYDHAETNSVATDERMEFSVNGDNKALTLHSDLSAKFEGHIGAGGMLADGVISGKTPSDGFPAIQMFSHDSKAIFQVRDAANSCLVKLYDNDGGTVSQKVELHTNGTSYFNGGNVAIGATSSGSRLKVKDSVDNSNESGIRIERSADGSSAWLNCRGGAFNINTRNHAGNAAIPFQIKGHGTEWLKITDGTQDHKANSIVNSATVAGLQDGGACYDFDGSSSYITFDSFAGVLATNDAFTISIWFKSPSGLSVASNSQILISAHSSGNSNILRIGVDANSATATGIFYSDGQSGDATLGSQKYQDDEWHHLIVSRPSGANAQTAKFYVDGVEIATDDIGPTFNDVAKWSIGQEYDGGTSDFFDGQIKDVKIFPSELDAADIRKLYSGENPKKNLNVLIYEEDTADDSTSNWANDTNVTNSHGSGIYTITNPNGHYAGTYTSNSSNYISVTAGKTYKASFKVKDGTTTGVTVYFGLRNAAASYQFIAEKNDIFTTSEFVEYSIIGTALSGMSTAYIYIRVEGNHNVGVTDVTLEEVGTLVDFTPQSASSTQWRNEAIPALYHGTVNNATLSQGNTYWNNIKQDGFNIVINSTSTAISNAGSFAVKDNVDGSFTSGLSITRNNADQTGYINMSGGAMNFNTTDGLTMKFRDGGTSNFEISPTAVKVANKLGVGGAAATRQLEIHGAMPVVNLVRASNSNAEVGIASSNGALMNSSSQNDLVIVRNGEHGVSIGTNNIKRFGITSAGVATFTENVVIGGTVAGRSSSVATTLSVEAPTGAPPCIELVNNHGADNLGGESAGELNFVSIAASNAVKPTAKITATTAAGDADASEGILKFFTATGGTSTERLSIDEGGTQDHHGNRIVNSQTVSDSWRTSEPSLYFNHTDDKVDLGTSLLNNQKAGTISAWVKWEKFQNDASSTTAGIYYNGSIICKGDIYFTLTTSNAKNLAAYTYDGSQRPYIGTTVLEVNKWYHVAYTWTTAGESLYVNGVKETPQTTGTSPAPSSGTNTGFAYIHAAHENGSVWIGDTPSTAHTNFEGEIKNVCIHNRAMEADEVKGLYNGESTPYKYANAPSALEVGINGTFDSNYTGWSGSAESGSAASISNSSYKLLVTNNTGGTNGHAVYAATTVIGNEYVFSAEIEYTNANASLSADNSTGGGEGLGNSAIVSSGTKTVSCNFVATATTTYLFLRTHTSSGGAGAKFDNAKLEQAGEVAAYTPQSIEDSGQWYDVTSNGNHGAITGATSVNNPLNYGAFQAVGKSDSADLIKLSNRNKSVDDYTRIVWEVEDGNSTALRKPAAIQFKTTDADAPKGKLEIAVADTGNYSAANDVRIKVDNTGEVQATRSGGSLKQVARVHSDTITIPASGDARATVTHNLGTSNIVLSVKESSAPYEDVEVHWKAGTHTDSQTGNKATIYFASNPSSDTNYTVTLIG